jgi:D-3-phosphoglycerate dehydrogenase
MLSRARSVVGRQPAAAMAVHARALATSATAAELDLLEELMKKTKARAKAEAEAEAAAQSGSEGTGNGTRFQIQTFNAISPVGLKTFEPGTFMLTGSSGKVAEGVEEEPHAVLLRSHKLQPEEVGPMVRAIARCGAGTNNIPIDAMTARGIPVFNTPGANANAVKELVVAAMLCASRDIIGGVNHVKTKIQVEEPDHKAIAKRIETDKKHFGGQELAGKTLGVCGLGNIGAMVAEAAIALGMKVVGYDPKISVDAAWRLPNSVKKVSSLEEVAKNSDYISINMPYIPGVTSGIINGSVLSEMKPSCHILNMARGEIVDGEALLDIYKKGHKGKYICDFADEFMQEHPNFVCIPHLGASTEEAEDNCAKMAAEQIISFLETGEIRNSVNLPNTALSRQAGDTSRLCIITENKAGMLGQLTTYLGESGINIAQQINTSRDSIAYNVIDIDESSMTRERAAELQQAIIDIDGVISTRIIWTGSAAEGPSNFLTTA